MAYKPGAGSIQGQTLQVNVVGARNLSDKEWFSRQDPYVMLEYGNNRFRTRTDTDGGKNPTFNEKFSIPLIEGLREFNVSVYNSNTITVDDYIGGGRVLLEKVLSTGYDDAPWALKSKHGKTSGEVNLIMHFAGAATSGKVGKADKMQGAGHSAMGYPPAHGAPGGYPPSGYPPSGPAGYPPSGPAGYPPSGPAGYPPSGPAGYPPSAPGYPPSVPTGYPPAAPGYPQPARGASAGYPPAAHGAPTGYPPQGPPAGYPPEHGSHSAYPSAHGALPSYAAGPAPGYPSAKPYQGGSSGYPSAKPYQGGSSGYPAGYPSQSSHGAPYPAPAGYPGVPPPVYGVPPEKFKPGNMHVSSGHYKHGKHKKKKGYKFFGKKHKGWKGWKHKK